jgi:hypothetical protein
MVFGVFSIRLKNVFKIQTVVFILGVLCLVCRRYFLKKTKGNNHVEKVQSIIGYFILESRECRRQIGV